MAKKPLYGKVLTSRSFPTQEQARNFAQEMKAQYKEADLSLKYDIARTAASEWTTTVFVKV